MKNLKTILQEIIRESSSSPYRLEKALEKTSYKVFNTETNKQVGFITFLGYNVPLHLKASSAGQGWYFKFLGKGDTESVVGNTAELFPKKFLTKELAAKALMQELDK